jgi:hypothetical protein
MKAHGKFRGIYKKYIRAYMLKQVKKPCGHSTSAIRMRRTCCPLLPNCIPSDVVTVSPWQTNDAIENAWTWIQITTFPGLHDDNLAHDLLTSYRIPACVECIAYDPQPSQSGEPGKRQDVAKRCQKRPSLTICFLVHCKSAWRIRDQAPNC